MWNTSGNRPDVSDVLIVRPFAMYVGLETVCSTEGWKIGQVYVTVVSLMGGGYVGINNNNNNNRDRWLALVSTEMNFRVP